MAWSCLECRREYQDDMIFHKIRLPPLPSRGAFGQFFIRINDSGFKRNVTVTGE